MGAVVDVMISKWGNSQGLRIPKEICDSLGVKIGSSASLEANQLNSQLIITFHKPTPKYHRNRKISMEELCAGWSGEKIGKEWSGCDVGSEVVE